MTTLDISLQHTSDDITTTPKVYGNIQDYYNIAGPDYEAWSPNFNMHFGYCKHFMDIFSLEKMLNRMNDEVLGRLQLPADTAIKIADLGCGVGTVARHTAKKYTHAHITGTTIVDYQVEKGIVCCRNGQDP
jgi:MPBQ/MSBQ methyltransferase